jgi:hypothetical protein
MWTREIHRFILLPSKTLLFPSILPRRSSTMRFTTVLIPCITALIVDWMVLRNSKWGWVQRETHLRLRLRLLRRVVVGDFVVVVLLTSFSWLPFARSRGNRLKTDRWKILHKLSWHNLNDSELEKGRSIYFSEVGEGRHLKNVNFNFLLVETLDAGDFRGWGCRCGSLLARWRSEHLHAHTVCRKVGSTELWDRAPPRCDNPMNGTSRASGWYIIRKYYGRSQHTNRVILGKREPEFNCEVLVMVPRLVTRSYRLETLPTSHQLVDRMERRGRMGLLVFCSSLLMSSCVMVWRIPCVARVFDKITSS